MLIESVCRCGGEGNVCTGHTRIPVSESNSAFRRGIALIDVKRCLSVSYVLHLCASFRATCFKSSACGESDVSSACIFYRRARRDMIFGQVECGIRAYRVSKRDCSGRRLHLAAKLNVRAFLCALYGYNLVFSDLSAINNRKIGITSLPALCSDFDKWRGVLLFSVRNSAPLGLKARNPHLGGGIPAALFQVGINFGALKKAAKFLHSVLSRFVCYSLSF